MKAVQYHRSDSAQSSEEYPIVSGNRSSFHLTEAMVELDPRRQTAIK